MVIKLVTMVFTKVVTKVVIKLVTMVFTRVVTKVVTMVVVMVETRCEILSYLCKNGLRKFSES